MSPSFAPSKDPNRVVQRVLPSPRGEVWAWFKGGVCRRVRLNDGKMYGWEKAPAVWAAVQDGSFRALHGSW